MRVEDDGLSEPERPDGAPAGQGRFCTEEGSGFLFDASYLGARCLSDGAAGSHLITAIYCFCLQSRHPSFISGNRFLHQFGASLEQQL